nr:hypothetical protein [Fodinicola feengrottensis]
MPASRTSFSNASMSSNTRGAPLRAIASKSSIVRSSWSTTPMARTTVAGSGSLCANSSSNRRPVTGVRNWCDAFAEKDRSRRNRSPRRSAVLLRAAATVSISTMPLPADRTLKSPSPNARAEPASRPSGAEIRLARRPATRLAVPSASSARQARGPGPAGTCHRIVLGRRDDDDRGRTPGARNRHGDGHLPGRLNLGGQRPAAATGSRPPATAEGGPASSRESRR